MGYYRQIWLYRRQDGSYIFYKWDIVGKFGYIGGKMGVIEACPPVNQIILKMLISQNEYS